MADISRVQPTPVVQKVQNQAYKVQASDAARDQKRHHEEREAPHDTLELHEEGSSQDVEIPFEAHNAPASSQDHGLDIAI